MHDRLGNGYTLLRLGSDTNTTALAQAFDALGAPFEVLDLPEPRLREVYGRALVLVRPDLHVAWRGDAAPADPRALARTVTGRSVEVRLAA